MIHTTDLRHLDALLAEHLFGWTDFRQEPKRKGRYFSSHGETVLVGTDPDGYRAVGISVFPSYSINYAGMGQVLEAMSGRGWHARLTTPFDAGENCHAGFTPKGMTGWNGQPDHEAHAPTLPEAVAWAALKALGWELNQLNQVQPG
mgnify:FL=1